MYRTAFHQGWQLECERFPSTSWENCQQRLSLYCCPCCIFLQRFPLVSSELIIAKELLKIVVDIKISIAIRTSILALYMSKKAHTVLYVRIVMQHPRWSNRTMVGGVDESKGECKLNRLLSHDACHIRVLADFVPIFFTNQFRKSFFIFKFCSNKFYEPFEFWYIMQ